MKSKTYLTALPLGLLLSFGSGVAALIYEIVWFQLLELVIGSTAVSLGVLLATFMGGCVSAVCYGRAWFPRGRCPLGFLARVRAPRIGIGVLGVVALHLIPLASGVYTAWSGYGLKGFLLRGIVAAACLLPPTLLMGATLPALARQTNSHGERRFLAWFLLWCEHRGSRIGMSALRFLSCCASTT